MNDRPSPEQIAQKHAIEKDIQNLLEILNQASNVKRYSRDFMFKEESLLEHIGFTAMFCMIIGRRLRAQGHLVSMSSLLEAAVIHDVEEILTGDLPRPTKYSDPQVKAGLKAYERRCVERLQAVMKVEILKDWENAKDGDLEGRIVAVADIAAVVYKTMVEVAMFGNKSFLRVSEEIREEMERIISEINNGALTGYAPLLWVIVELYNILIRAHRGELQFGEFFRGVK